MLDKDSLEEVEAGLNGMRVLREEGSRLIDASHKKQEQIEQEREAEKRRREEKEREREREKKRRRMQQCSELQPVILTLIGFCIP